MSVGHVPAIFGAAHHEAEVPRLGMLSTGLEAIVHGGLQADWMATAAASLYGVLSVGRFIHRMFLR
jgi:hypothetical protein